MGVDAVVKFVVPGEKFSEQQLKELSAKLCISLGAEKFFLEPERRKRGDKHC